MPVSEIICSSSQVIKRLSVNLRKIVKLSLGSRKFHQKHSPGNFTCLIQFLRAIDARDWKLKKQNKQTKRTYVLNAGIA